MDLSQNKNTSPTYAEKTRDRLTKSLAMLAIFGSLVGAVELAHDSHPAQSHPTSYFKSVDGINPADIRPNK